MENRFFLSTTLVAIVLISLLSFIDPIITYHGLPWHYFVVRPAIILSFLALYLLTKYQRSIPNYYYDIFSYLLYLLAFYGIIFIGPAYTFAFMHVFITIGIVTQTNVRRFCVQALVGVSLCIIGHYYMQEPRIITQSFSAKPILCLAAIIFQIISTFIYLFVTRFRLKINELNEKYALIGKQSSFLIHEIKTPLARVQGKTYDDRSHELLSDIHQEANRILSLINSVETLIYLPEYLQKNFKTFRLEEINQQLTKDYAAYLKAINITYLFENGDNEVTGDKNLIYQSFKNLLINAVEAIGFQENQKPLIHITSEKNQDKMMISIKNTHSHIPRNELKRIWEPSFSTKDPSQNKGIGLTLAKSIIEAHKGSITVESNTEFTEFKIALPL